MKEVVQPNSKEAPKKLGRDEYLSLLTLLDTERIINPTQEDLIHVTPHLTEKQRKEVFTNKKGKSSYVACPPTLVRKGYNVVHYRSFPLKLSDGKIYPPTLSYAFAKRTLESYADRRSHGDIFYKMPYQKEAMEYAERAWGDKLIIDNWNYYTTMYLQDPTDLVGDDSESIFSRGGPKTKLIVRYTSYRDGTDMANDHSKPQSVIVDDAFALATLNRIEASEIKGGRGGWTEFTCAHCGGGLSLNICNHCGNRFRDDHIRSGSDTPISPKIVKFIQDSRFSFAIDPKIAQKNERELWRRYRGQYLHKQASR